MKLHRKYGFVVATVMTIVMMSCGGGPIEHGTEYIVECKATSDTTLIGQTFLVLENRLNKFGLEGDYQMTRNGDRFTIKVRQDAVKNPEQFRRLLQTTASLEFRATYPLGEIGPTLNSINETYARINHIDSADLASKGFFSIFAGGSNIAESPLIGYVRPADTASVMNTLRSDSIRAVLPADAVFHWGLGTEMQDGTPTLSLIACRDGRNYVMTGNNVADATAQTSQNGGGMEISIQFTQEGADDFAKMTKNNIGKSIAIELDNFIYSYPTVYQEITGGAATISGNFTKDEAENLASILKAGSLPAPVQIISENTF